MLSLRALQFQGNVVSALDATEGVGARIGQGFGNILGGLEVPDERVAMSCPEEWDVVPSLSRERSERHLRPVLERGLSAVDLGVARAQPLARTAEEAAEQFVRRARARACARAPRRPRFGFGPVWPCRTRAARRRRPLPDGASTAPLTAGCPRRPVGEWLGAVDKGGVKSSAVHRSFSRAADALEDSFAAVASAAAEVERVVVTRLIAPLSPRLDALVASGDRAFLSAADDTGEFV